MTWQCSGGRDIQSSRSDIYQPDVRMLIDLGMLTCCGFLKWGTPRLKRRSRYPMANRNRAEIIAQVASHTFMAAHINRKKVSMRRPSAASYIQTSQSTAEECMYPDGSYANFLKNIKEWHDAFQTGVRSSTQNTANGSQTLLVTFVLTGTSQTCLIS